MCLAGNVRHSPLSGYYTRKSKSIGCSKSVDQSFSINAVMLCRMFEEKMEGASHTSYNKNDHKQR